MAGGLNFRHSVYDEAMSTFVREVIDGVVNLDPLLRDIATVPTRHAGPIRNVTEQGVVDQQLTTFQQEGIFHHDVIRLTNVDEFVSILYLMGTRFRDQLSKNLIETLLTVTESSGNTIDKKGDPLSWNMFLELIEAMEVRFDADGQMLSAPTVIMNPETAARLDKIPKPDDFEQRIEEILLRKRDEFNAEKRRRRVS